MIGATAIPALDNVVVEVQQEQLKALISALIVRKSTVMTTAPLLIGHKTLSFKAQEAFSLSHGQRRSGLRSRTEAEVAEVAPSMYLQ